MKSKHTQRWPAALSILLMGALSISANAQNTPTAQSANAIPASNTTLPTVKVTADALDYDDSRPKSVSTATKTALDTKDVPQTINALEVSKFKVYGINDLSVLLDGVAGVDTYYDMRGDGVMLRGFAADSGDIYRDGVRASGQIRRSTANVERIEILKGPASVLYGRGLGGGVVNMISKQASFDAVSSVGARFGSYGNRGATVDVNKVLSDNVAVRLTADYEQADSFRHGIESRNKMISPSILFDNKQGLTWLAQYTYDSVWRIPDRAPSYDSLPSDVSYRTAYAHPDDFVEDKMQMFRSVLGYDFGNNWALKWTLGYHDANQDFDHLYAGSYCKPDGTLFTTGRACSTPGLISFTRAWQVTNNTTLSNTFDLTGKLDTFGVKHDVLVGLEHSNEKRRPDLSTSGSTSDPAIAYPGGVDPYNPVWLTDKVPYGPAKTSNRHLARAQALYLQDLISFSEQWKMMAGLRYDRYTFDSHNLINDQRRSFSGNSVSPRVGLIWQPVKDHSLYVSYSKNFSPYGGRGLLSVTVDDAAIVNNDPEYSRQYEVGLKSDWLNGALSSQIAVYNLERYNQRYRPDPENDPYTWAVQGEQRSRGVEVSVTGRIVEGWYVRSGFGWQKATVTEDLATPANVGKFLANTSRKSGNLFLRYVPRNDLYAEAGVTYHGEAYNNLANTSLRPAYTRWDASIGWRPLPWTVTLAVTNLTDKRYWRSSSMPGAPRSVLLSANYIF